METPDNSKIQTRILREFTESDLEPINSFKVKDHLLPAVWKDYHIKGKIREALLEIAQYFYDNSGLNGDVKDIVLTGSIANYNWSRKYSDFDLHIIVDLEAMNSDVDLIKKTADLARKEFNLTHEIKIFGFPVEVYIQDVRETNHSTGVFSLMKNRWNIRPIKGQLHTNTDTDSIKRKAIDIMEYVDHLEETFKQSHVDEIKPKVDKIWDKVKDFRKQGLDEEESEMSVGNLVFKLLRRNGYIEKIIELKRKIFVKGIGEKLGETDK